MPCLFSAFKSGSVLKVNFLLAYIQEHFDTHSLKEQLLWKSEENENIIHILAGCKNSSILDLLFELLKTELDSNVLKLMFLEKNKDGEQPLSTAMRENEKNIEKFLSFIEKECCESAITDQLASTSKTGETILHLASKVKKNGGIICVVIRFMKKLLTLEKFKYILLFKSQQNKNFLNSVLQHQSEKDIAKIFNLVETEIGAAVLSDLMYDKSNNCYPGLFSAFESGSVTNVTFTVDFIRKNFIQNDVKKQILHKTHDKKNILNICLGNADTLLSLLNLLRSELDSNSMESLFLAPNKSELNLTISKMFCENEIFSEFLKEVFTPNTWQIILEGKKTLGCCSVS
jgi:hypothetical protein